MRKIELSSALAASTISARSVSRTTMPSRVAGSNILTVPCMCGEPASGLDDLAGLEAGRADIDALRRAVDDRAHALHVRVPPPLGAAVRVAEPHPEDRLLAAHVTHGGHPGKASTHYHSFPMLTSLSAADLRQAVLRFRDALRAHQEELNRLNVYPVPDGDTGTNMALTLESVSAELATAESMEEVCHAISRGSLMGARGNSGVILSQILRGFATCSAGSTASAHRSLPPACDARAMPPTRRSCIRSKGRSSPSCAPPPRRRSRRRATGSSRCSTRRAA